MLEIRRLLVRRREFEEELELELDELLEVLLSLLELETPLALAFALELR